MSSARDDSRSSATVTIGIGATVAIISVTVTTGGIGMGAAVIIKVTQSRLEEQVADKKLLAMIKPARPIPEMTEEKLATLANQIVAAAETAPKPTRE